MKKPKVLTLSASLNRALVVTPAKFTRIEEPTTSSNQPRLNASANRHHQRFRACMRANAALSSNYMSDLRNLVNSLSTAEKAELLDAVWESLEGDSVSLIDMQGAELDHRIARHEQNPSNVIPWEQARAGLFKKP